MDNEDKLAEKFETYRKLGDNDKNIDVAALMMQELQNQKSEMIPARQKHWAYLVAISLPPLGLIFAFKFYFSKKTDGRQTAAICAVLTGISLALYWLFGKILFSGSGVDINQIRQITPKDIQQLYQ